MSIRALLLDVEGVLVADKRYQAVFGAVGFIDWLRTTDRPFRLISNNTTDPAPAMLDRLCGAGFDFSLDELFTCTGVACRHLQALGVRRCLVLGTPRIQGVFRDAGFEVSDDSDVEAVIVGLDVDLTFDRLRRACDAVARHDAVLLALHRNRVYTDHEGRVSPSVGPIVEAIVYATRAEPILVGKPSPTYYRQVLDALDVEAESALVVSDDPFSDLAGAKRLNMQAAFVLSGKYADARVIDSLSKAERPDLTVERIADLQGLAGLQS